MVRKPRQSRQQQSLNLTAEDIVQSIKDSKASRDERVKRIRTLLAFDGEVPLEAWQTAWYCLSSGPVDIMVRVGERAGWQVRFPDHSTAILEYFKKEGMCLSAILYEEAKKNRLALKQMLALQDLNFPRPGFDERELIVPLITVGATEEAMSLLEKHSDALSEEVATLILKKFSDYQDTVLDRLPAILSFKNVRDSLIKRAASDFGRGLASLVNRASKAVGETKAIFLKELAEIIVETGDIESCAAIAKLTLDDLKLREKLHARVKDIVDPDPSKMIDLLLDGKLRTGDFERRMMMRNHPMGPSVLMWPPFAGRW